MFIAINVVAIKLLHSLNTFKQFTISLTEISFDNLT